MKDAREGKDEVIVRLWQEGHLHLFFSGLRKLFKDMTYRRIRTIWKDEGQAPKPKIGDTLSVR